MAEKTLPNANYLLLIGIALLVFGCMAIASPAVAGTSVVIVIGAILVVSGVVQVFNGFYEKSWASKLLSLVLGAITLLGGLAVLAHPLLGMTVLALVLAIYFVTEGIWKIIASFSFRPASGWLGVLGSGVIALVLGFLIWRQWPLSGLWAVGVLVGADLVATGLAMLLLASTVRRIKTAA
jgi:membrane protein HdeD